LALVLLLLSSIPALDFDAAQRADLDLFAAVDDVGLLLVVLEGSNGCRTRFESAAKLDCAG